MSFVKKGASAFGKLIIVVVLAGTFIVGMASVVYMSLQGKEMKVPEITGKDFVESEKELTAMGLRIKKRADRYSTEKPNIVLEQLPKAGDTVKTGQMILVVTSKTNPEGEEAPTNLKKNVDDLDDTEKIEELISDKPKKPKANTNAANSNKKKASTTRDVASNNSNSDSDSDSGDKNSSNKNSNSDSGDKSNKNSTSTNSNKPSSNSNKSNTNVNKPVTTAPKPAVSGGDTRPRKTTQP